MRLRLNTVLYVFAAFVLGYLLPHAVAFADTTGDTVMSNGLHIHIVDSSDFGWRLVVEKDRGVKGATLVCKPEPGSE